MKWEFSKRFHEVLITKYRYPFIFYLGEGLALPVIIGVIRQRRDVVQPLE